MTAEYAHTADRTTISRVDFPPPEANRDPIPLREGASVYVPKAAGVTILGPQPSPGLDVYTLVRDTSSPPVGQPNYYVSPRVFTDAFSGDLGQATGTVTETIDWTASRLPIGDLYNLRLGQLANIARAVYDQGVEATLESNGVQSVRTTVEAAIQYDYVGKTSGAVYGLTGGLPPATTFRAVDQWGQFYPLTAGDCGPGKNLSISLGLHYTTVAAVLEAHTDELQRLRDVPDWDGLATYDITTDWPEAPTANKPASATTVTTEYGLTRTVQIDTLARALQHPRIQGTPGGVGTRIAYVYRFLLRNYAIRDDATALFQEWLSEHPGA